MLPSVPVPGHRRPHHHHGRAIHPGPDLVVHPGGPSQIHPLSIGVSYPQELPGRGAGPVSRGRWRGWHSARRWSRGGGAADGGNDRRAGRGRLRRRQRWCRGSALREAQRGHLSRGALGQLGWRSRTGPRGDGRPFSDRRGIVRRAGDGEKGQHHPANQDRHGQQEGSDSHDDYCPFTYSGSREVDAHLVPRRAALGTICYAMGACVAHHPLAGPTSTSGRKR